MTLRISEAEYRRLTGKQPKQAKPRVWKPKKIAEIDGIQIEPGYTLLVLPVPKSQNQESLNCYARGRYKKEFESMAFYAWIKALRPKYSEVMIFPVVYSRVIRHRDGDNLVALGIKGAQDGLKGHLVKDDNSELLTMQAAEFLIDREYPRLELHVMETI